MSDEKQIVYVVVEHTGSYSDQCWDIRKVFKTEQLAEDYILEITKVPEIPDNWMEFYNAARDEALDHHRGYMQQVYEQAKFKVAEIDKGRATIQKRLDKAVLENDTIKIAKLAKEIISFGSSQYDLFKNNIASIEADMSCEKSFASRFHTPENWKRETYRAKALKSDLSIQPFEVE